MRLKNPIDLFLLAIWRSRSCCLLPRCSAPTTATLDTNALATLAVQDHGRKKPFTTFAQEMLLDA